MHASRARAACFALIGAALAAGAVRADELGIAPPDGPIPVELDIRADGLRASLAGGAGDAETVSPPVPDVAETGSAGTTNRRGAAPAEGIALPPPDVAAPVAITSAELLSGGIEARLADPKLPLPPKLSRKDRDALSASYAKAGYRPRWVVDGRFTPRAEAVLARLSRADEDGLDPAEYPAPAFDRNASPADQAEAELKLSAAAFLYARDARGGRVDPGRIGGLVVARPDLPSVDTVLTALDGTDDPNGALGSFNPAYPGYHALRAKLADLRARRPPGPLVRADRMSGTVAAAGSARDLRASTGRIEGDIIANMERWRWLPPTVAKRFVFVNVPEYQVRVIEDGRVSHETRAIVGRTETPTPIFSDVMEYAIVNPSWFIPPSILRKDILPGLARDPNYAAQRGYQVVRRGKAVSVRQPPGPRNALGYIKFMFPNDYAVYLHDTPNRSLFGASQRALSHGCVRVENPFALGGRIIGGNWSENRLRSLIGAGERTIFLAEKMPVHLTYFTVGVDEFGDLRQFDDIYGYHRRVRTALGLGA